VSLAEMEVLDLLLQQCEDRMPGEPKEVESIFEHVGKLSSTAVLKPAALKFMTSILQRAPDALFNKHFLPFYSKRILAHLNEPRKLSHCLQIVCRVFSGLYQGERDLHPRGQDPTFRACAFSARIPESSNVVALLDSTYVALIKRKALHIAFSRHRDALIAVFVQMAVNDMEYVTEHMLKPMLVRNRSSSLHVLLALKALRYCISVLSLITAGCRIS
jgi:hypothetical protein